MQGPNFQDAEISGLSADSRRVGPGYLFAALSGARLDGRDFIPDAIGRGAAAILVDAGTVVDSPSVPIVTAVNPRRAYARMAAAFHGRQPGHIAAVTGTNGKTSVAEFTRQIWSALGHKAASVGTLGVITGEGRETGSLTTPDAADLHARLGALARAGVDHAVLEASSHGLDQYRLDGVAIGVAAFTNLSRDHLDYHDGMEAYLAAKTRLFAELLADGGAAVINADDPTAPAVTAAVLPGRAIITYGRRGDRVRLLHAGPSPDGTLLRLEIDDLPHTINLPLIGWFQVMNTLAAYAIAIADGADVDAALAACAQLKGVPGRVQFVGAHAGGAVYVDYAHTPDALANVLAALRPHVTGKLVVVFGCGGDRDTGKRTPMGATAAALADRIIVTDDNPRSEEPAGIRRTVLAGCPGATEIGDRAQAIAAAIDGLGAGDIVVIAGKGHETGQIIGDQVLPFDDAEVAAALLRGAGP